MTVLRQVNFYSEANWELIANPVLTNQPGSLPNTKEPLPPYTVPLAINTSIVAYSIYAENAKDYWRSGGYMRQLVKTQINDPAQFSTLIDERYRMVYGGVSIKIFPFYFEEYALRIDIPFYMHNVSILVWKYIGPDVDVVYTNTTDILGDTQDIKTELGI